jgi:uncharacterized membrane protein YqjE
MMQFFQAFWGKLQEYMETRISLLKIEIKEEIAKAASNLLFGFVAILALFMAIALISVGLSQLIGSLIGYNWAGSFIIGLLWFGVAAVALNKKNREKWQPILEAKILTAILAEEKEKDTEVQNNNSNPTQNTPEETI